jgi:hypothetical protein
MATSKETFIRTIYDKINSVLGNDNQLFMMEFPARGLNPADFEYSTEHRTSIVTKPYSVMEREFRLTDDLFNVGRITGGPNGEKLSTVFDTIINNYVPSLASYTAFARDKVLLRRWLMEKKEFTDKKGEKVMSSRIAFCETLMNAYLEAKLKWENDKKAKFDELKATALVNGVEVPALLQTAMDDYARWLGSTGLVRDEQLNQLYNDVVVRGNLHEVMTFLGFLNASTTAEALETTKQFMRNSSRLSVDSSSKIYPVTLNPTNWFKSLRPNFSPKDLTMSTEALTAQYRGKVKALAGLKSQKAELELMTVDDNQIKAIEGEVNTAQDAVRQAEQEFLQGQTEAFLSAAKMAYQAAKAAGPFGQLTAVNTVFRSRMSSLTDTVFDDTNLLKIQEGIAKVGNALDTALAAKEKHVSLMAKKSMLQSHNFKSQIQKIDSQIELLTSDIQYLEPLVSGTLSIAESEVKKAGDKSWNKDSKDMLAWVLEKMIEKHADLNSLGADKGITADENKVVTAIDKTKLTGKYKTSYEGFEADYNRNTKMAAEGVVPKAILPESDLDISDLSFTDIIMSNEDTTAASAKASSSQASSTTVSARGWFTNFKYDSSQSSAQSSFENTALSSKFECGFRVAKVTIDRGGWFNPTLLKMSSAFFRLADVTGGSGITMDDIEADTFVPKAKKSLLPAFPVAFVIAKDITIKISDSAVVSKAANSNAEGKSSIGGGFGPFAASSASTNSSTSETAYTGTHGESFYIRIPGPQIIGWYLQFTPEDKSVLYSQQSNDKGTGAVDILTLDDEAILTELRLRREQLEDKIRSERDIF